MGKEKHAHEREASSKLFDVTQNKQGEEKKQNKSSQDFTWTSIAMSGKNFSILSYVDLNLSWQQLT